MFCLCVCMLMSGTYKHQQRVADVPGIGGLDICESPFGSSEEQQNLQTAQPFLVLRQCYNWLFILIFRNFFISEPIQNSLYPVSSCLMWSFNLQYVFSLIWRNPRHMVEYNLEGELCVNLNLILCYIYDLIDISGAHRLNFSTCKEWEWEKYLPQIQFVWNYVINIHIKIIHNIIFNFKWSLILNQVCISAITL